MSLSPSWGLKRSTSRGMCPWSGLRTKNGRESSMRVPGLGRKGSISLTMCLSLFWSPNKSQMQILNASSWSPGRKQQVAVHVSLVCSSNKKRTRIFHANFWSLGRKRSISLTMCPCSGLRTKTIRRIPMRHRPLSKIPARESYVFWSEKTSQNFHVTPTFSTHNTTLRWHGGVRGRKRH
jgi:hypothetical protein